MSVGLATSRSEPVRRERYTRRDVMDWLERGADALALLGLSALLRPSLRAGPAVRHGVDLLVAQSRLAIEGVTSVLVTGGLGVTTWHRQMLAEVQTTNTAAAQLIAGKTQLNPDDQTDLGWLVGEQVGYLNRFRDQLQSGVIVDGIGQSLTPGSIASASASASASAKASASVKSAATKAAKVVTATGIEVAVTLVTGGKRAVARAAQYAASVWAVSQRFAQRRARRQGKTIGKRVLGAARHCDACVYWAGRWMPIESIPPIGTLTCHARCHCHIEYR